jgi:Spy/CpxP family protein refolding chaperone
MKTKYLLIAGIALAAGLSCNFAQSVAVPPSPLPAEPMGDRGRKHGEHGPLSTLNLTPDLKTRIETVMKDTRPKMQAIRTNASLTNEQKKEQLKALRESIRAQMKSILTPEQFEQLQKAKAEWKEKRKQGGCENQTAPSPSA